MNKARRKEIDKIAEELEALHARLDSLRCEEQDYFDNMPESFQYGDKGSQVEEGIAVFDDAMENIEGAIDYLQTLTSDY